MFHVAQVSQKFVTKSKYTGPLDLPTSTSQTLGLQLCRTAHVFNPNTLEGGRGRRFSVSSRPARSTERAVGQLELLSETLAKNEHKFWDCLHLSVCLFSSKIFISLLNFYIIPGLSSLIQSAICLNSLRFSIILFQAFCNISSTSVSVESISRELRTFRKALLPSFSYFYVKIDFCIYWGDVSFTIV